MIVSQDGNGSKSIVCDRFEHRAPSGTIALNVDLRSDCGTIPLDEELEFIEPLLETMGLEALHR
jgi:hypothetical protein